MALKQKQGDQSMQSAKGILIGQQRIFTRCEQTGATFTKQSA